MKCKSADPAKIGGVGGLPVCKMLKVNVLESANPPTGEGCLPDGPRQVKCFRSCVLTCSQRFLLKSLSKHDLDVSSLSHSGISFYIFLTDIANPPPGAIVTGTTDSLVTLTFEITYDCGFVL